MKKLSINERSWAIEIISEINTIASKQEKSIKRASGEMSLKNGNKRLFPDVILHGKNSEVLIGWELKMPDTPLDDAELLSNAQKKAILLNTNSFLIWNACKAILFLKQKGIFEIYKVWDTSEGIINCREDVEKNPRIWKNALDTILQDLNDFFLNGQIRPRDFTHFLSYTDLLEDILQNNTHIQNTLKRHARQDGEFEAQVSMWWRNIHHEYINASQWEVLSNFIVVSWISKILFIHILVNKIDSAQKIYTFNHETSPEIVVDFLKDFSEQYGFSSVLGKQLGDTFVDDVTWDQLMQLNIFMTSIEIKNINQNILQRMLEDLFKASQRKIAGQYTTPYYLARLLVLLTLKNRTEDLYDPCCGTGTIIRAAIDKKKEIAISDETILKTVYGSDKSGFLVSIATFAYANQILIGEAPKIFKQDCLDLIRKEFLHNCDMQYKNIATNLPFVQHEDLQKYNKNIKTSLEEAYKTLKIKFNLRSDLYSYFPIIFFRILVEKGRLGIIVSNSWLGTDWGDTFRKILAKFYEIEYVIQSSGSRWFRNSDVLVNIVIMKRRSIPIDIPNNTEQTSFVSVDKDFNSITNSQEVEDIYSYIVTHTECSYIKTYRYATIDILSKGNWTPLFNNLSWMNEIESKLVGVEIFFNIFRGARDGWNDLFYPSKKYAKTLDEVFLKPALRSFKQINKICGITQISNKFCCNLSEIELEQNNNQKTLKWIRKFEVIKNKTGKLLPEVLASKNRHWYSTSQNTTADLVTSVNHYRRIFINRPNIDILIDQRLIGFKLKSNQDKKNLDILHALINSILSIYFIETIGFPRGQGALDLSSTRIKKHLKILDPTKINSVQRKKILDCFNIISQRKVDEIDVELEKEDRQKFDMAVLEAYGIEHLYEQIKHGFLYVFKIRESVSERHNCDEYESMELEIEE